MFEDHLQCYQAIADELVQIIPEPWKRIEVEAELTGESSINTKVTYVKPDGGEGSTADVIKVPRYFFELARLVSTEEKGLYKKCNFILNDDGKYDVDFVY